MDGKLFSKDNRVVRVFISSTFHDMQDERDELIKKTFPLLKKEANNRDVVLTEKDLRWGITKEESENGNVLDICFKEIDNCIPFFIGIVGHRYGWVPLENDISSATKKHYTQINDYVRRGLSATEMEIQYGVLERQENINACFFIKEDDGSEDEEPEVQRLKAKIINNGRYPFFYYKTPHDLGSAVYRVFGKLIEDLFPITELSTYEKERLAQNAYMHELNLNYVQSHMAYKTVFEHWLTDETSERHMIITGEAGVGKSAFVADLLKELYEKGEDYPVRTVFHFIGLHSDHISSSYLMDSLTEQIRKVYGYDAEDVHDIYSAFLRVNVSDEKPLLIVLDGVDIVSGKDEDRLLTWLISPPKKVKILFSVRSNHKILSYFKQESILEITPLNLNNRKVFIQTYLSFFSKKLSDELLDQVSRYDIGQNPYILKAILNELIKFGEFEHLSNRIEELTAPKTEDSFFEAIISNFENDYQEKNDSVVPQILSFLSLSKNGFCESDIVNMLRIRPIDWSTFYCAFDSYLVKQTGLISLKSEIKNAAYRLYIHDDIIRQIRERIINYYRSGATLTNQVFIEIPFQYVMLEDAESLYSFLLDLDVLSFWVDYDPYEFGRMWNLILSKTHHSIRDYCELIVAHPRKEQRNLFSILASFLSFSKLDSEFRITCLMELNKLLEDASDVTIIEKCSNNYQLGIAYNDSKQYEQALTAFGSILEYENTNLGKADSLVCLIADAYVGLASVYGNMEDYEKDRDYALNALNILKENYGENHLSLNFISAYNEVGVAYYFLEDWANALKYQDLALQYNILYQGENNTYAATGFNNVSSDYRHLGDFDKAIFYAEKGLAIRESLMGDNHIDVANSHSCLSDIYSDKNDLKNAILHKEQELMIFQNSLFNDKKREARCYLSLGILTGRHGDKNKAFSYFEKALYIHIQQEWVDEEMATILDYMATICMDAGQIDKVIDLLTKKLSVYERTGDKGKGYIETLLSLAKAYDTSSDYERALMLTLNALQEEMNLYGNNSVEVAECSDKVAFAYDKMGNINKALQYTNYALKMRQSVLGLTHYLVAVSYLNFGHYLELGGYVQDALDCGKKSIEIIQSLGEEHNDTLWRSYLLISTCQSKLRKHRDAILFAQKSLDLQIKELGRSHPQVAQTLDIIGAAYNDIGEARESIKYSIEALRIRRAISNDDLNIAISLYNIAYDCFSCNEYRMAIQYGEEAIALAKQCSHDQIEALSLLIVAKALIHIDDSQRAFSYLKRGESIFASINDWSHATEVRELIKQMG